MVTRSLKFNMADGNGMAIVFIRVFRFGLTVERKL